MNEEKEPLSEENVPLSEEKEPKSAAMSNQKRTALLRYMMVLFAVAFLLVLLSYLIQVFNSQSTISQLNATSASALQNAERLQDTNRELTEENEQLKLDLDDAREALATAKKDADAAAETARDEGRAAGEAEGRQAGQAEVQKAYDLLLKASAAADETEKAKAIEALSGMEDLLSESARKQLEALKTAEKETPGEQETTDNETEQTP